MDTYLIVKKKRIRRSNRSGTKTESNDHGTNRRTGVAALLEAWLEDEDSHHRPIDDQHVPYKANSKGDKLSSVRSQNGIVEAGIVVSAVGRPSLDGVTSALTQPQSDDGTRTPQNLFDWSPEIPFRNV